MPLVSFVNSNIKSIIFSSSHKNCSIYHNPLPKYFFLKKYGTLKTLTAETKNHGVWYFPSLFPGRFISLQKSQRLKHKKFCARYNLKHNNHSSFQGGKEGPKLCYQCTRPLLWADLATTFLLKD